MSEVNIKDIANIAGVSVSTVSRVINDNYPVSAEVKKRVQEVMKNLDYHPNAVARSLRMNRTNTVALIIADLTNNFFMGIAKGLEYQLSEMGYSLVIASSGGDAEREKKLIDMLVAKKVDALVAATVDSEPDKLKGCIAQGIPVVLVDRLLNGISANQISWNNFESAYRLTELLIKNGHKRIGIINVHLSNSNGVERLEGFRQAMEDYHISLQKEFVSQANFSERQAYDSVQKMMRLKERPTALFCANNVMVEGALSALQDLELKVYEDISLVAMGNLSCNKYINPKITCAVQDSFKMGVKAGDILKDILAGKQSYTAQIRMETELKEYGSVKKI